MLEGLAGDNDIGAFRRQFPPIVWIAQDNIDVIPGGEIDPDITPRRQREERAIRTVYVLAAQIEDDERLVAPRFQVVAPESGHFVEGTLVHLSPVNRAG